MAIKNLDYKLQGSELRNAVADVLSRINSMNGRYEKGGGFGLDFYSDSYEIENYRWITERANIADKKINAAEISGMNVDDPEVLSQIAKEVAEIIKIEKSKGSYLNYILYLIIPIIVLVTIFVLLA